MRKEERSEPGAPALPVDLEESAEDLYDNAPCGYISALEDGTIVRVNRTLLRWTGYERDELVGRKRFQDLLSVGGRIYHETHYAPLLRMQGSVREIAVDIVRRDRSVLPALVNSVRKPAAGTTPALVRTTIFDATERRHYEQELLAERKRAQESEARVRLLADTLQASLIPPEPSQIPGLDVAARYRPAGGGDTVGGDFYDVFETPHDDWVVVVGDVSGKGVEAARVTAAARYTLRASAMRSTRPRVVLTELNKALLAQDLLDRFCTVTCARISQAGDRLRMSVSSAGHPLPIVVPVRGEPHTVGASGTLLGAFDDPKVSDETTELASGDIVVFYTDGVTEARAGGGEFFGEERFVDLLAAHRDSTADALADIVVDEVLRFQHDKPRDDIAVLVLRRD